MTRFSFLCVLIIFKSCVAQNGDIFPDAVKNETDSVVGYPKAVIFFKNYKGKPLLMRKAASGDLAMSNVPDSVIAELPHSFTIFVKPQNSEDRISLRRFLKVYANEKLTVSQQIPVVIKSQIKLPPCLDCEALTDENLSFTNLLLRRGNFKDDLASFGKEKAGLSCLLDGEAKLTLIDVSKSGRHDNVNNLNIAKDVKHFHEVKLNPGDCIHIPANWMHKLTSSGRTIMYSIVWDVTNLKIRKGSCGEPRTDLTLDGLKFKDENQENIFSVLSLANLALFIENYVQWSNMTEENFLKKFKTDWKLKDLKQWDEECDESAQELFSAVDVDKDKVLSPSDFDSLRDEDVSYLAGFLEDKMGDFKDIIEDQISEIKPERTSQGLADKMKSTYEIELQRLLQDGFNEILKEADIDGSLKFSDDGTPEISINENEKKISPSSTEEQVEEIIADDLEPAGVKEEL